jgi:hypothetical protein
MMSGSATPPGGPLPQAYDDALHGLTEQARAEDRQAVEARKRAARRPFNRFVRIGALLILAQTALLAFLYYKQGPAVAARTEFRSILPANSCSGVVNSTYWKIVAYLRAEGHPPGRLEELVPKYLDKSPLDPGTGKPLSYSTDGTRFQVRCPEITVAR